MMIALLHSNGQLRTERDGDTEKGCQKPAVQQPYSTLCDLIVFGGQAAMLSSATLGKLLLTHMCLCHQAV